MKNFIYVLIAIFIFLCTRKAYGAYSCHIPFEHTIEVQLDNELAKNLQTNKWGYRWAMLPLFEGNRLTYTLMALVKYTNLKITSSKVMKQNNYLLKYIRILFIKLIPLVPYVHFWPHIL